MVCIDAGANGVNKDSKERFDVDGKPARGYFADVYMVAAAVRRNYRYITWRVSWFGNRWERWSWFDRYPYIF
jgi:hypothetical protein